MFALLTQTALSGVWWPLALTTAGLTTAVWARPRPDQNEENP